jgi:hypothetical protein
MPFGIRESINFDQVYLDIIRPAGEEAGWEVMRIDEIVNPGPILNDYLREIFFADLVLADVSTLNANVFYELGIRHAIANGGTLLIALEGTNLPFDIANLRVIFYELSEKGIIQAKSSLRRALSVYRPSHALMSNPIRTFLEQLGAASNPVSSEVTFEQELHGRITRARNADQLIAIWQWAQGLSPLPALALLSLADRLADYEAWHVSVEILRTASIARPKDFEIHRQLGWHLRHLGTGFDDDAIASFQRALDLNPGDP